jgi:hypothetical protein
VTVGVVGVQEGQRHLLRGRKDWEPHQDKEPGKKEPRADFPLSHIDLHVRRMRPIVQRRDDRQTVTCTAGAVKSLTRIIHEQYREFCESNDQ